MSILLILFGFLMFCCGVHLIMRIVVVDFAKRRFLFSSPDIGRIQQRIRGGKVVGYLANLSGLTDNYEEDDGSGNKVIVKKFLDINEKTGEVIPIDKAVRRGFWWKFYGVRFIGLDDIQTYDLEITKIQADNSVTTELVTAHSLHYSGVYSIVFEGDEATETVEGTPIFLRGRVTTITHSAGQCLKYKSQWLKKLESSVKSALRDFVGKNELRVLLKMQNENPSQINEGLVPFLRSLNNGAVGNSGLIDTLGQEIRDFNLESIKIDPEVAEALKQAELAQERKAAEMTEAQKNVAIAEEEKKKAIIDADAQAEKTRREGNAVNDVLRGRFNAIGGADGVIGLAKWEAMKDIKDLKGTLVINDGSTDKAPAILLPGNKEVRQ